MICLSPDVYKRQAKGYKVGNVDATICAERPKLKARIPEMQLVLAHLMGIDVDDVSVKATTTEKLGLSLIHIYKLEAAEKYDIKVNLYGGGFTGQSQALRLAIARALVKINPEDKTALRSEGFMTRDSRSVERKKPGQPKARRRFQFSKR